MSSIPNETQATYENLYADFQTAISEGNRTKAKELIIAMSEFSMDEVKRFELELAEMDV